MSAATQHAPATASFGALLKEVSRSFYLTLRVLPGKVRPQIGVAYLLARATDTIADTQLVAIDRRLDALRDLQRRILSPDPTPVDLVGLARQQGTTGEGRLLEQIETVLGWFARLAPEDQLRVREVLGFITSGQELDLKRFANASEGRITALMTDHDLEDYTYRVAGCVGEFWTKTCRAHLFPKARLDDGQLLKRGVRFGQGLQLVNILRDLPADLRLGRCYVPLARLKPAGLRPAELLDAANEPRFRALYRGYLDQAEGHLAAGWDYTNMLPWSAARVRLACAWAILIGVRTLAELRVGNVLDATRRIKVSRAEVRRLVLGSLVYYPWRSRWSGQFDQCKRGGD
ncbi:MAG: squalene/phytoene synthase family protein [Verrucomicrobia bacterium]|nr:squalene/phytoene synthase family protein [Verrucomicrobiota bacterium]